MEFKYKITDVAKDFGVPNKKLSRLWRLSPARPKRPAALLTSKN